jgi:hypothetical protein
MGKTAKTTKVGAVHAHATVTLVARTGQGCPNEGKDFTFEEMPSIDYSNSPKDVAIKGTQLAVVTRAVADTDPKWSAEVSKLEHRKLIKFLGKGAAQFICDITCTWQVPGSEAFTDTIEGCFIGDEGTTSKSGDGVMAKLGSGCTRILYDGIDVLESPIT